MYRSVLIGVGEADLGRQAVELARRLAGPGAELALVRIHGGYTSVGHSGTRGRGDAERRIADVLLRRARVATRVQNTISHGAASVPTGLAQVAAQTHADLIVVGSSPSFQPGQLALDPTLTHGLGIAPCAVAIAPSRPATAGRPPFRRIGLGFEATQDGIRALTVARRLATVKKAGLTVFAAEGSGLAASREQLGITYALGQLWRESDALDLIVVPSRLQGSLRSRISGSGLVEQLAASAFAPMLMVTRNTPTTQAVGGPAAVPERTAVRV